MSILSLCITDQSLERDRCVLLAAIHDLAEGQVGDIAPSDGVSKEEKYRLEAGAMSYFVNGLLHGRAEGLRIQELWDEYEQQVTPEARLVKDLDLFEMALQAMEYERSSENGTKLDTFFESSIPRIRHTEVTQWAKDLMKERDEFWNKRQCQ